MYHFISGSAFEAIYRCGSATAWRMFRLFGVLTVQFVLHSVTLGYDESGNPIL